MFLFCCFTQLCPVFKEHMLILLINHFMVWYISKTSLYKLELWPGQPRSCSWLLAEVRVFFSSLKNLDCLWDPLSLPLNTYRTLSVRIKQLGHYGNHSSVLVLEVENEWRCTSTSPYTFLACTGTALFYLNDSWGVRNKAFFFQF